MNLNQIFSSNTSFINRMNQYSKKIESSNEKLSSGISIQNPADIVKISKLEGEIRGSQVAQKNMQDGFAFIDTVDAVLSTGAEIGYRLKELAESYKSTTLSQEEKDIMKNEVKGLTEEFKNIFESATFNGKKIFDNKTESILTGGQSSISIEIPDLSTLLKENFGTANVVKDIESFSKGIETVSKELLKSVSSIVESKGISTSPQINTVSSQKAIESYQKTMDSNTKGIQNAFDSIQGLGSDISNRLVKNMVETVFKNNKEVMKLLNSVSSNDLVNGLKEQSYDSLKSLSNQYGFSKEFELADKLGLFDLLGIKGKKPTENPNQPTVPGNDGGSSDSPSNGVEEDGGSDNIETPNLPNDTETPTTPDNSETPNLPNDTEEPIVPDDSGIPSTPNDTETPTTPDNTDTDISPPLNNGSSNDTPNEPAIDEVGNGGTTGGQVSNPNPPATNETDTGKDIDIGIGNIGGIEVGSGNGNGIGNVIGDIIGSIVGNNGGINIGIGNGNIDIGIDIGVDIDITLGNKKPETTPSVPDTTESESSDSELLNPDFADKVLDVISKGQSELDIKRRILEYRMSYETRMNEIKNDQLTRITDVDIAKEISEKVRNQMLESLNANLFSQNLDRQRQLVQMLFQ